MDSYKGAPVMFVVLGLGCANDQLLLFECFKYRLLCVGEGSICRPFSYLKVSL
jgi:hypothetical protein